MAYVVSRESMLQRAIISRLAAGPVGTITELAKQLQSLRPSVSKSLKLLRERGQVHRTSYGWELTDRGRDELEQVTARILDEAAQVGRSFVSHFNTMDMLGMHEQMRDIAGGIAQEYPGVLAAFGAPPEFAQAFDSLGNSSAQFLAAATDPLKLSEGGSALALAAMSEMGSESVAALFGDSVLRMIAETIPNGLNEINPDAFDAMSGLVDSSAFNGLRADDRVIDALAGHHLGQTAGLLDAAQSLAELQTDYMEWGAGLAIEQLSVWGPSLFDQAGGIAATLSNVIEVQNLLPTLDALAYDPAAMASILAPLPTAASALGDIWRESMAQSVPNLPPWLRNASNSVESYSQGSRYLVEDVLDIEEEPVNGDMTAPVLAALETDRELDLLLEEIEPKAAMKRREAWTALSGVSEDRLSHAGISCRGMWELVLHSLAPDDEVSAEVPRPLTRKARIKHIAGGSKTVSKFIDTMAAAIDEVFAVLDREFHPQSGIESTDLAHRAFLSSSDSLMLALLDLRRGRVA